MAASATAQGAPSATRNVTATWAWPMARLQAIGAASQPLTIQVHSLRSPRRTSVPTNRTIRNASQMSAAVSYGRSANGRNTMARSGGYR